MKKSVEQAARDLEKVNKIIESNYTYDGKRDNVLDFIAEIKGRYANLIEGFSKNLEENYDYITPEGIANRLIVDRGKVKKDMNLIKEKIDNFIRKNGCDYTYYEKSNTIILQEILENSDSDQNYPNVSLENVIQIIQNNTSLPEKEIQEIIAKLNQIDKIVKDSGLRKNEKWYKIKDITKFILDKGLDIGKAVMPYINSVLNLI
jgi:hypothetical protein